MRPSRFLRLTLPILTLFFQGIGLGAETSRPNIVWLSAEDISPHLGCYGDPHAITPHLDRLAQDGVRFSRAFTTAGVCAPCRSGIITGLYQTSIGTQHMRCDATLPPEVRPFPMLLREAGYYCSNHTKTDYQFSNPNPREIWDDTSSKAHWRNRPQPDQPFFAVFNFTGCHESGIASASKYREVTRALTSSERQDAAALELPPYYPDTPTVREDWKRNYELITAMDAWAGELIQQLKDDGLADNTIVFFWSDHGVGLPRAKRWLYDSGTLIPLIVHIPPALRQAGQGAPGSVDGQLVSSIDFGPTVLNLAQVSVPAIMQGRAFLGSNLTAPRSFIHGARDRMDERYDIIRTVRDARFRYVRNYEPLKPYYQYMNTAEKGATMQELRRVHAEHALPAAAELFMADSKPVEEFYDLDADPYEIHNLINDPAHAEDIARLRSEHQRWVRDTADLGLLPESEITRRTQALGSCHAILHQPGANALRQRLASAAEAASSGPAAQPAMLKALADDDAAVRYWGATGVGNLVRAGSTVSPELLQATERGLKDTAPCVRIAAARALLHLQADSAAQALAVLRQEMQGELEWARLQAAIVLDEADELALPALDALQAGLKNQPNKYIVRVCNKAVNDLLGTQHEVP
ncbi:MAG: sulfatase-like hydrolase/transferase [Verrucomicrobiales bacterium]|nr:sulfatase-like hydrolase/transferase [Verrucomicrobiales bacterium]